MPRYPQRVVTAVALIVYGSSAMAQITATGPFTGTIGETWESFNNYTIPPPTSPNYLSNPTSIFGGAATISDSFMAGLCQVVPGRIGFRSSNWMFRFEVMLCTVPQRSASGFGGWGYGSEGHLRTRWFLM